MLILTRFPQQSLKIGDTIEVKVLGINGNQVRFGIKAPKHVTVLRDELIPHPPAGYVPLFAHGKTAD